MKIIINHINDLGYEKRLHTGHRKSNKNIQYFSDVNQILYYFLS